MPASPGTKQTLSQAPQLSGSELRLMPSSVWPLQLLSTPSQYSVPEPRPPSGEAGPPASRPPFIEGTQAYSQPLEATPSTSQ